MAQEVTYMNHMGDDLFVVNCARVSFDAISDTLDVERDTKLINYLAKHKHWSPFSHCIMSFRFKTPFFVRNQLYKHMIGLNVGEPLGEEMAWNEVSRRYVDYKPEYFKPDTWRKRAKNKKQGSANEEVTAPSVPSKFYELLDKAQNTYDYMLKADVCPEQARMILPQCAMTEWIWTGSIVAWHRVASQRLAYDTQKETRDVVAMMIPHLQERFPISWAALEAYYDK